MIVGSQEITYAELNQRANQLAHYLQARGVLPGAIVAIYLPRGLDAVIAILAILKAGGAYLPIDTADPSQRVVGILNDVQAAFILSTGRLLRRLEGLDALLIPIDHIADELAAATRKTCPTRATLSACAT